MGDFDTEDMKNHAKPQGRRHLYHDIADDIKELRGSGGDRAATAEDFQTNNPNWWHGYYKRDMDKYGSDRDSPYHKDTIKRALKHLKGK